MPEPSVAQQLAHPPLSIEHRDPRELQANPANYRHHPPEQIAEIKRSLQDLGQYRNVVCRPDGTLLAGHGVVQAAVELGWPQIAVHVFAGSEAKARRLMVADNELSRGAEDDERALHALLNEVSRDFGDLAGTGWTDAEHEARLAELAAEDFGLTKAAQEDPGAGEPPEEAQTRLGDVWLCGAHRVVCGDSTTVEAMDAALAGAKPYLCVTDPPYGVKYDPEWRNEAAAKGQINFAARRTGKVANDDRADWREVWALLTSSVIYCWHGGLHGAEVQESLEATGFELRAQIIWAKPQFVISRGAYNWKHEPCFYAVRKGETAEWIGDHSQVTVWDIALDHRGEDWDHGTQKPVECMARPMRNHSGDVIDPFLGSGTTLIAAEKLGRVCYGIELEPRYVDVALRRWAQMTGEVPVLEADGTEFEV